MGLGKCIGVRIRTMQEIGVKARKMEKAKFGRVGSWSRKEFSSKVS